MAIPLPFVRWSDQPRTRKQGMWARARPCGVPSCQEDRADSIISRSFEILGQAPFLETWIRYPGWVASYLTKASAESVDQVLVEIGVMEQSSLASGPLALCHAAVPGTVGP